MVVYIHCTHYDAGYIKISTATKYMSRMKKQKNTSLLSRVMRARSTIVVEIVVLVIIGVALAKEVVHKHRIERDIAELQAKADSLQNKNSNLQTLITYFESDTFTEEQARLQLGMQRPGESVVTVLGVETDQPSTAGVEALAMHNVNASSMENNPQRWWNHFFSHQ